MYLLTAHNREEAETLLLVLESQGIEGYLEHNNGIYDLFLADSSALLLDGSDSCNHGSTFFIDEPDICTDDFDSYIEQSKQRIESAREIIALFYAENVSHILNGIENSGSQLHSTLGASPEKRIVITRTAVTSVALFVLLLCTIHAATIFHNNHREVVFGYGSSALYVLQGEYYRVITALMLHADIGHLAANVAGMLFLAVPLCSITGAVRGLVLILLSGAAGNLMNACLYRSAHLSIGASTSVMGAVGILVAFQITRRKRQLSTIAILACGATFVGMMSGGKETDVPAHIFGFLAGLILGILSSIGKKYG